MMMCNLNSMLLVCLTLVSLCSLATFGATISGVCPGGTREGDSVDLGSFWYECRNGRLAPKGCITSGSRVLLGQTSDQRPIRWQCVTDADGYPALVHKSCLDDQGREHLENERWNDGKAVYTCQRHNSYLTIEPVGCADGGRQINLGEKVNQGDVVYECKLDRNRLPTLKAAGCYSGGRQYNTGDSFDDGKFWYYCMDHDGVISVERSGCVHNGVKMSDGDHYVDNEIIYECYVRKTEADVRVVGCVSHDTVNGIKMERKVGCSWQEGTAPFQHTHTCQGDAAKKTATAIAVNCNYMLPEGSYTIGLGCYRVIDKRGMACMKGSGPNDVKFVPLDVDENGNVRSPPPGLRNC